MNLESRLRAIEAALFPQDRDFPGVTFTPSDERPPPPSDRRELLAYMEACAMDATIPDVPDDE